MKNILWLASWYPNKLQPFTGDFIERHAKAASLYHNITVLFIVKDAQHPLPKKYFIEERKYNDRCRAMILYYHPFSKINFFESILSGLQYWFFFAELVRQYIHDHGKPDIVHVHAGWKAGLIALYSRWRYKLNYVLTEHWSGFMPKARPSFSNSSWITRLLVRKIFRHALKCSAVSKALAENLQERFGLQQFLIIPNVVDTSVFQPDIYTEHTYRFIHISNFNFQKNPEQLFEAVKLLGKMADIDFELLVVAPDEKMVKELAQKYSIEHNVVYRNYVPQEMLALEMNHADALVLCSRYETFGCVVIEAMASGIPVIVSDLPVMHENVDEQTGVFSPLSDPSQLAQKMLWMMNNKKQFNPLQLAERAQERYGFERIGKLFNDFYQ